MNVLINWKWGILSQCVCVYIPISTHREVHFKYLTVLSIIPQQSGKKKEKNKLSLRTLYPFSKVILHTLNFYSLFSIKQETPEFNCKWFSEIAIVNYLCSGQIMYGICFLFNSSATWCKSFSEHPALWLFTMEDYHIYHTLRVCNGL